MPSNSSKKLVTPPSSLGFWAFTTVSTSIPIVMVLIFMHNVCLPALKDGIINVDPHRFWHLILLNTIVIGLITVAIRNHLSHYANVVMLWFWLVLDVVMVGGAAHVLLSFFSLNDPLAWEDWFDYIFVLEIAFDIVDLIDTLRKVRKGELAMFSREVIVFCFVHHTLAIVATIILCQLRLAPNALAFFTFNILSHVFVVIARLFRMLVNIIGESRHTKLAFLIYRWFQLIANVFLRVIFTALATAHTLHDHDLETVTLKVPAGRELILGIRALCIFFLLYNSFLVYTYVRIVLKETAEADIQYNMHGLSSKKQN